MPQRRTGEEPTTRIQKTSRVAIAAASAKNAPAERRIPRIWSEERDRKSWRRFFGVDSAAWSIRERKKGARVRMRKTVRQIAPQAKRTYSGNVMPIPFYAWGRNFEGMSVPDNFPSPNVA